MQKSRRGTRGRCARASLQCQNGGAAGTRVAATGGNGRGEAGRGPAARQSRNGGSSVCAVDGSGDAAGVAEAAFAELVSSADRRTEAPAAAGDGRRGRRTVRGPEKSKHPEDIHLVCRGEVRRSADNSTDSGSGGGSGSCYGDPSTNGEN